MSFVESAGVTTRWTANTVTSSAATDTGAVNSTLTFGTAGAMDPLDEGTLTVLGPPGGWGTRRANPVSDDDTRVRTVDVPNMQWPPGMGPFFSQILPDGTVATPHIQLTVNQVASTGTTMSCGFFHPDVGYYTVTVPTTTGRTTTLSVNSISGVESAAGGADLSDCTVAWDGTTPVLYCLSAFPYRGWRAATVGLYPVIAAFTLNTTTGLWEYNPSRSIWPATLAASHVSGPNVFPSSTNFYGETVVGTLLPAEITTLPVSGHLAISVYAPRSGHLWGSLIAVDPAAKTLKAWYEWPDMTNVFGWGTKGFTRDLNADPTSIVNDERIAVNHDVFIQPNETFNVTVWASSGTWKISYAGTPTVNLTVGATDTQVQAALETVVGAGNVAVRFTRPFLVATFTVYEIELIGSLAHTDLTATAVTVDTSGLVANLGTTVNRWRHGGTGYTTQGNFPFSELSYNAGTGTIVAKTVPMFPMTGTEDAARGERPDASAAMTWYTTAGDLVVAVGGHSQNPNMFTAFASNGMHIWKSAGTGVDRGYVTGPAVPTTGWEARYGEARPTPDVVTRPIHADSNAFVLGVAEDQETGTVVAPCSSGTLLAVQPHGRWQARSGRLWRPGTFGATADVTGTWTAAGGHAIGYSAGETAMQWTAASTADGVIQTATGTAGLPVAAAQIGDVVTFYADTKAATVRRLIRLAVRFWGPTGSEVSALTGYGASVSYDSTTGYRRVVGAVLIPAGTSYLSFQIEILGPGAAGEIHYIRTVDVRFAPYWSTPAKVDMGTSPLYVGATGGKWTAKGFVDPETRMLWVPYLQQMAELTARGRRFPAWFARVNVADLFPVDRTADSVSRTAVQWTQLNAVLDVGVVGEESDTGFIKVGDGVTAWTDLGYGGVDGGHPT